jgi:hypothetical protein
MRKDGSAIFDNVFIKRDASLSIAQQPRQRSLSVQEWEIAQIPAEGVEDRGRPPDETNPRTVTSRQARAQPSIVKLLALFSSAAAAIADSRADQS